MTNPTMLPPPVSLRRTTVPPPAGFYKENRWLDFTTQAALGVTLAVATLALILAAMSMFHNATAEKHMYAIDGCEEIKMYNECMYNYSKMSISDIKRLKVDVVSECEIFAQNASIRLVEAISKECRYRKRSR